MIDNKKGKMIAFEGCEGVGKTTQIERLKKYLDEQGIPYVFSREPGGTETGEEIRKVLKNEDLDMSPEAELLLFEAARCDNVKNVLMPALEEGKLVICDRYIGSTVAYQAFGRGLKREMVDAANEFGSLGLKPDLTIFLDAKPFANTKRSASDRMELAGKEFHERVYAGYKKLEEEDESFVSVKTSQDKEETTERIIKLLKEKNII